MTVHVLAIGAHPDDVELGVGGLLHKLARHGYTTAILDLTEGELASRGTVATRLEEARQAAERLGIGTRVCARLPDGGVENTPPQRERVVAFIRELRPGMLLAPMGPERHPDHSAAHALVHDANFLAGVHQVETGHPPCRASHVHYYFPYHQPPWPPRLVVDISEDFEAKLHALRAYASQFHNPNYRGHDTWVASKAFWDAITTRARYWGDQIGVAYGEPLYGEGPLACDLPPGLAANVVQPPGPHSPAEERL